MLGRINEPLMVFAVRLRPWLSWLTRHDGTAGFCGVPLLCRSEDSDINLPDGKVGKSNCKTHQYTFHLFGKALQMNLQQSPLFF